MIFGENKYTLSSVSILTGYSGDTFHDYDYPIVQSVLLTGY